MRARLTSTPSLSHLALVALLGACGSSGGATPDAGSGDGGAGDCTPACTGDTVCRYGQCVPPPEPCASSDDCAGDFYCDVPSSECLPWGVGPGGTSDDACTREVVAGVFFPEAQCEWLGPPDGDPYPDHINVLGSPMVADFRGFGDPELSRPSIVFISYNFTDGGAQSCQGTDPAYFGVIRVIDGRTCEQQATIDSARPIAATSVALGDLTGNGIPEIVAARVGGGLVAWELGGGGAFDLLWETTSTYGAGTCNWTGPSIHDLDDDGVPEILLYGAVFSATGDLIDDSLGLLNAGLSTGYIPVVADVDRDGVPNLVTGPAIYRWNAVDGAWELSQALGLPNGHIAVADFGTYGDDPAADDRATLDGIAEIVWINQGIARIYTITGREIDSFTIPGGGTGGPPTIADFDGDGRVEFAAASRGAYSVFDLDCLGTRSPDTCPSLREDGILWTQESQDVSSSVTGSSVFDFEGDGIAEAVYGDECYTRVYEGTTGEVLYSRYRTSCTWYENPIVADVDADFGAEIVIASNINCDIACPAVDPIFDGVRCFDEADCPGATECRREDPGDPIGRCRCTMDADCGGDGFVCLDPIAGESPMGQVCRAANPGPASGFGVRVVGDQLGRWVATRPIWNQHAYSVTNVGDLGRIPRTSEWVRNWDVPGLNNFRQNAPGEGAGAGLMPDLTVRQGKYTCSGPGSATLSIEVCNRGTEPVANGLKVTVFHGDEPACTAETRNVLRPGLCETVSCEWPGAPTGAGVTVRLVADDDGTGKGRHTECREDNNELSLADVTCP